MSAVAIHAVDMWYGRVSSFVLASNINAIKVVVFFPPLKWVFRFIRIGGFESGS